MCEFASIKLVSKLIPDCPLGADFGAAFVSDFGRGSGIVSPSTFSVGALQMVAGR